MKAHLVTSLVLLGVVVCLGTPPPGFEVIDVGNMQIEGISSPHVNECGEVVFSWGYLNVDTSEVFLYDNGVLTQITDNTVSDASPDINDEGTMVWMVGYDGWNAGQVVMYVRGETTVLGEGKFPFVNNLGHVTWYRWYGTGCDGNDGHVFFYDGAMVIQISDGGISDRQPVINDLDDIVWGRVDYCPEPDVWSIRLHRYMTFPAMELPSTQTYPGTPTINNTGQVAWGGEDGIEFWEDGVTTLITDWGHGPELNDQGDMFFIRWHEYGQTWQTWMRLRTGEIYQLTDDPFWNTDGDINNYGEAVWRASDLAAGERGVRMLRRIRTGEADFDGDIDLDDYAVFNECRTGPIEIDYCLCECRFLDIDHDNDVDLADFALFQNNFTGSE